VPSVPTSGDAEARTRFERAHSKFERDRDGVDSEEFAAIAEEYPEDPIAPYAMLYAGIAATRAGDYADAVANLETLDAEPNVHEGLRARGRLYLGISLNYLGKHGDALPHLRKAEKAIENDAERAEWLAAMAEATSRSNDTLVSLVYYDRWHAMARPAEQAYIVARLRALVGAADASSSRRAYDAHRDHKSPAAAILGARVAADFAASGDHGRADRVRNQTAAARERLGLVPAAVHGGSGDPGLLGVVLPLSGKRARVGDSALRGLVIASDALELSQGRSKAASFELSIRDTASSSAVAAEGATRLAAEGVIAVVGPVDGKSVDAVARRAAALGVTHLSLNPRSAKRQGVGSPYVFHVMHSAEDRARVLARYEYQHGVRDFAILKPDGGYGRAVGKAFHDEVVKLGGTIVVEATYKRDTTSFSKVVGKIRKPWQAVFVPDLATRLELVAPALASANLISTPIEDSKPRRGRKILLLSTAESLAPRYVRSAARYSRGAVFAPGFYPDRFDPLIAGFVDRYEEAFGRLPAAIDAYAYDAAVAVNTAVASGARARDELSRALAGGSARGLTGQISFGPSGSRSDSGLLFRVDRRADMGELVIRALRD